MRRSFFILLILDSTEDIRNPLFRIWDKLTTPRVGKYRTCCADHIRCSIRLIYSKPQKTYKPQTDTSGDLRTGWVTEPSACACAAATSHGITWNIKIGSGDEGMIVGREQ
jgi:hypothetical protein